MLSRLFDRSVRCLTACLAVVALVTALAVPVQAAPRGEGLGSDFESAFVSWIEVVLRPLAILWNDEPEDRELIDRTAAPGGQCLDPNGQPIQCPEPD
jgi:hypothetical protein